MELFDMFYKIKNITEQEYQKRKLLELLEQLQNGSIVNHPLCDECEKNNVSCYDGEEVCLPLEMFVTLCKEQSNDIKLEMINNVMGYLDLE